MNKTTVIALAAFFLALTVAVCWPVLENTQLVFSFNDGSIESALLPDRLPTRFFSYWGHDYFVGKAVGTAPLCTWSLLDCLLGPHHYRRLGVVLAIWLTGLASLWTLRQFKLSTWACTLGSLLMMLSGWNLTFPMNGLTSRSFTLAWCTLSVGMLEKGRLSKSWLCHAVAGALLGMGVSDTPDIGIFFAFSIAVFYLATHLLERGTFRDRKETARIFALFALYVICSIFIAHQIIFTMFNTQISGHTSGTQQTTEEKYNWATQWSLPKAETWSLIVPDYHGASSRSAESPYWGRMGQSAEWPSTHQGFRNFRLAGYAIGAVPVVFIVFFLVALFQRESQKTIDRSTRLKIWTLATLSLATLMFAWGRYFPLYRLFYALPYMSFIRNPDKWLGPFTMFISFVFAFAVDYVFGMQRKDNTAFIRKLTKKSAIALTPIFLIAAGTLVYMLMAKGLFYTSLDKMQFGNMKDAIFKNSLNVSITTCIILSATYAIIYSFLDPPAHIKKSAHHIMPCLCVLLVVFELCRAGTSFVVPHDYSYIRISNPLVEYLDQHRSEGRIKLLPPNYPLFNNWRMTLLINRVYHVFDPQTVRSMPSDYDEFFKALQKNPVRLWQLSSVRYFICTDKIMGQLKQLDSPAGQFIERESLGVAQWARHYIPSKQVPQEKKFIRIAEFTGAMPLCWFTQHWQGVNKTKESDSRSLAALASNQFNPATTAIVHSEIGTGSLSTVASAPIIKTDKPNVMVVTVQTDTERLLVRSTKFHPDWKVFIDDKQAELHRVNYLFQGVFVPAGTKEVRFQFLPSNIPLIISLIGRALLMLSIALVVLFDVRTKKNGKEILKNA